jgi:hypothetical protein
MLVKKGQFSAAVIKEDYGIIFLQSLSQTLWRFCVTYYDTRSDTKSHAIFCVWYANGQRKDPISGIPD